MIALNKRRATGRSAQTLINFFETVYAPMRLRGKSPNTTLQYGVQIRHFARWLGREPTLADLTDECVASWLTAHAVGRSPATTNKARCHLLALWRLAARKRLVKNFPDVAALIEPERVAVAWSQTDLSKLLTACGKETGVIAGILAADWWTALHLVLWDTGERIVKRPQASDVLFRLVLGQSSAAPAIEPEPKP